MFSQGLTITLAELPILSDFRKLDRVGYSNLRAAALGGKSQKPREGNMAAVIHTVATNIMQRQSCL